MRPPFAAVLLTIAWCLVPAGPAFALDGRLEAEGTAFVLRLNDGRVLQGPALVGLSLVVATSDGERRVRIDSVEQDATATGGPVWLYRLTVLSPSRPSEDLCQPDAKGRRVGFPVPDRVGGFSFTCTSGAEGKCILLGYRPWEHRDGVPMRELHRACVHMIRADYGGDDRPTTRNGTLIDVYDRFGIQVPAADPALTFEAGWSPEGAICVAHPRIAAHVSLADLAARYPRLAGRLGPQACSDAAARADPRAILFNRSAVTSP